jgi:hypothetical protein
MQCHIFSIMLSVIILAVIMTNVVAPFDVHGKLVEGENAMRNLTCKRALRTLNRPEFRQKILSNHDSKKPLFFL